MFALQSDQYTHQRQPATVGVFGFAYYFYFKGHMTLERALPGRRKS